MCLLFLCAAKCYQDLYTTIKMKIGRLHELTRAATYYEFFNLGENCSDSDIKKAFRKLRKSTPPTNLTKDQFNELVMNGYSVLSNYRQAYDNFLRESKFLYINEPENFRNYFFIIVISVVCLLVFIDFVVYAVRYLKYVDDREKYKKMKKSDTPADAKNIKKKLHVNPPTMISKKMANHISSFFSKRQ
ncbi:uncharacterized protein VICG_01457 [Vittaforma corneae ATCC 50505]|uniref:J domain-containing protein n=1 Tax=Vittaforma corneae (strain ATCC 50505) TaxID=993615 RepID=L2GKR1_VITCO|nr:uncharacterized protein VICG_01457 [Vittaforma corneae ATCC 50505]ELA41473.1 hypothetical protein VICG_01457 [Vittaforma corneae ATCC 50505]